MKKNTLLLIACCLFSQVTMAQAPKWLDKAKRAIFSVVTYDASNNIMNSGNGFFISTDGVAVSDYTLFDGAQRAVVTTSDGKQLQVESILGANSMYDVIKFRVDTQNKPVAALTVTTVTPAEGAEVFLVPYGNAKDKSFTAGKVNELSKIGENSNYYTLALPLSDKTISCPLLTATGDVFALAQQSSGSDIGTISHGVGMNYVSELSVGALASSDFTLRSIGIKKGLPQSEDQALISLLMASSNSSPEEYEALMDEFIKQFPASTDGYIRRATHYLYKSNDKQTMDKVAADLDKAMSVAVNKDDVHYNISKLVYTYVFTDPKDQYKDWNMDKALAEIRKAIAINPQPVYIQLEGDILFGNKDYAGAYACYEKVNQSNLASSQSFFSAMKAKQFMGAEATEVLALMDSCIAHIPTPVDDVNAAYYLERAALYMESEQYRPAMLDYDRYYSVVNGEVNDVFYYYREQASFHARQFQRALDDIKKAIELNPEEIAYHTELGVINLRVGRYEEAEKALGQAIKLDPKYGEAYRLLGLTKLQQDRKDEACANFAKAKELGDAAVDALIESNCK